jgi:hypothetical protein
MRSSKKRGRPKSLPPLEDPEKIERDFQKALAEIRRRGMTEEEATARLRPSALEERGRWG